MAVALHGARSRVVGCQSQHQIASIPGHQVARMAGPGIYVLRGIENIPVNAKPRRGRQAKAALTRAPPYAKLPSS